MRRNALRFGVALITFAIGAGLASLWLYKQQSQNLTPEAKTSVSAPSGSGVSSDYAKLIIGTWEGRSSITSRVRGEGDVVATLMYLTFNDDGTAVIDYSPGGGGGKKIVAPYRFKDERTIIDNLHPENLIIRENDDGTIGFSPEGDRLRVDIDIIYECEFRKIR